MADRPRAKLLTPHPWAGAIGPIVGGDDDFVVIELDRGAPWKTTFAGPGEWTRVPAEAGHRPWFARLRARIFGRSKSVHNGGRGQ